MFQSKGLISQIAMVESKSDQNKGFKKKINLPAAIFNRSPLRQTEKSSQAKTPTPTRKSITTGVSPLKSRRQESLVLNQNLNLSNSSLHLNKKTVSNRETVVCQNHESKVARYYVYSDDETLPYCQKCAILLASQGFKVAKMEAESVSGSQSPLDILSNHPRKTQVEKFLNDLQRLTQNIIGQKGGYDKGIEKINSDYEEQVQRVSQYYQYLFDVLTSHKESVLETLESDRDQVQADFKRSYQSLEDCLGDCNLMRQDILASLEVIKCAEEKSFRPVMESYKEKLAASKATSTNFDHNKDTIKEVVFNNVEQIGKRLVESIQIRLQQPESNEDLQIIESQQRHSSVYFSFDNQGGSNQKSDQENPVLQQSSEEERLLRSSMMKKGSRTCFEQAYLDQQ